MDGAEMVQRGWSMGDWANLFSIVASIAVIVTAIFVFFQIWFQKKGLRNEERLFVRQSIEFIAEKMQEEIFRERRRALFSSGQLADYRNLSDESKENARAVLSTYGPLCQMIHRGALEEQAFKDYWQSAFIRDWDRLSSFVEEERKVMRKQTLFAKTEQLARKWKSEDINI